MTAVADVAPPRMYIDGRWVDAEQGGLLPNENPATEEALPRVPAATAADVDRAVAAARAAAPGWAATPWTERAARVRALADRIEAAKEELAQLDTRDAGLPIKGSRGDLDGAIAELRYFAGIGGELKGEVLPTPPEQVAYTVREPFGVVGRIVPFNHPFKFAAGKAAAPLVAGNSVVLKPSEATSLSALELARLADGILPPGVLNVVTGLGRDAGHALAAHPHVPRIAFTGGVAAGRAVLQAGGEHFATVTLELGGKNPVLVFPDADPAVAARKVVAGMNLRRSMGQSCQSGSRVLVHDDVRTPFLEALEAEVAKLRVGDPTDDGVDMGPVAYRAHHERVLGHIDSARGDGATLVVGGGRPPELERGFFVQPTVFADVEPSMRLAREEVFGPVMAVLGWRDLDRAVDIANSVAYGLTANLITNDLSAAHRTARRIEAGLVWVNGDGRKPLGTPFGGVKDSGIGREGDLSELLSYTRPRSLVINV